MVSLREMLEDARRLSERLRYHDASTDRIISLAEENLKKIQAQKQYQEALEELNSASSNPRSQILLELQQESRNIRELRQENRELRAALEEHQNATELIMSKYRQHLSHMVNSSKADINLINYTQYGMLQERLEKIGEMASVMNYAVCIDEENQNRECELVSKLVTENRGLREMLEISRKSGSLSDPLLKPKMISRPSQTEDNGRSASTNGTPSEEEEDDEEERNQLYSSSESTTSSSSVTSILVSPVASNRAINSDDDNEDESVYNTIKRQHKRPSVLVSTNTNSQSDPKLQNGEGSSDGNSSSSPDDVETLITDKNSSKFIGPRVFLSAEGGMCHN